MSSISKTVKQTSKSEIRNFSSGTHRYRHLFFDLDHTLWDFELNSRRTWEQLFVQYGLEATLGAPFEPFLAAYTIYNERLWEDFRNGKIERSELRWKRISQVFADFGVQEPDLVQELSAAYLALLPTQNVLMPGAADILVYCKGRYAIHLITNGFETTQLLKMQHAGIGAYFDQIITSEKCSNPKPHRDIFAYAFKAAGCLHPDECLMLGDALDIDILGAQAAGWDQVFYNPAKTLHAGKPTYEIAHWDELRKIL